jgi:O-antigen/teichoic acid export membrane protein
MTALKSISPKRLFTKYRSMPEPLKASFWFLICGFIQKGMSFLTTPVFTRIMEESEYGRGSVYSSWYNILFIIASLELAAGVYTKGLIKNEEDADVFSSTLLSLSTVCVLAFSGIYLLFHQWINEFTGLSTYLMVVMIVEMWATIAYQFWANRERTAYRYKKLATLMIVFTILRPTLGVIAVLLADKSHQVEARVTVTTAVNLLLFGGLYISMILKGKRFFHKEYWKYALNFNLPLIPHYLSQVILNQSDRIMIERMCGVSYAGYYSVAYSLSMVMQIFNTAVSSTMNPWIYRSLKNKSFKRIGSISYMILLIIAGLNFVMVAMAPEALKIIAPGSFYQALWVIPPVTVSVYFLFMYNLFATFEYYYNKTKWVMFASLVGAVSNIALNLIFIPKFGFIAAGYTTLISNIIYAAMHYVFMLRVCDKFENGVRVYDLKKILLIGGALIVASGIMTLLYNYTIIRYVILLAVAVIAFCFRKRILGVFAEMKNKKS